MFDYNLIVTLLGPSRDRTNRSDPVATEFFYDAHSDQLAGLVCLSGLEAIIAGSRIVVHSPRGHSAGSSGCVVDIFANAKKGSSRS